MANMHLVTGCAGQEHVTAADHGSFNAALFGSGQFVLNIGNKLSASVITNNLIRVLDGDILMQGRHIRLEEGSTADLTIENGAQGVNRNDLIVARYTKHSTTAVEEVNLVVIKGTADASSPSDPSYTVGDLISEHDLQNDMPLYRVRLVGLNVDELVPLFTVCEATIPELYENKQTKTDKLTAETALADGDYFPFYDASADAHKKTLWSNIKAIFSNMFAAKDHSHTLSALGAAAASHKHDASAIESGILGVAMGGPGVASHDALMTALGAAKIAYGSYTGAGTYGSNNPNRLAFGFVPKLVIIQGSVAAHYQLVDGSSSFWIVAVRPLSQMRNQDNSDASGTVYLDWSGNGLSWYNTKNAATQLNVSGATYNYIAIG